MIFRKKNEVEFMIVFISSIGLIFVWNTIFPMVRSGNLIYPGKILWVVKFIREIAIEMLMHHMGIGWLLYLHVK